MWRPSIFLQEIPCDWPLHVSLVVGEASGEKPRIALEQFWLLEGDDTLHGVGVGYRPVTLEDSSFLICVRKPSFLAFSDGVALFQEYLISGLVLTVVGLVGQGDLAVFSVLGIPSAIIGIVAVLATLLEYLTTEFSCTDRRILIKSGFFTTTLREMPLPKVEALLMEQGLLGKLFGYGTLVFKGSGGTRRTCKSIEAPFEFYQRVQEQVTLAQARN
jgi:hypothetical protein